MTALAARKWPIIKFQILYMLYTLFFRGRKGVLLLASLERIALSLVPCYWEYHSLCTEAFPICSAKIDLRGEPGIQSTIRGNGSSVRSSKTEDLPLD